MRLLCASPKMAKEAAEATPESSWTTLAKGKDRGWWSSDLEGEMEKLEVIGPWSGTEGRGYPRGNMAHSSARIKTAREEGEKLKESEMEVDVERG